MTLILSFLLFFLSGGRAEVVTSSQESGQYSVSEGQSTNKTSDYTQNRELCIAAAQGYTFAGDGGTKMNHGQLLVDHPEEVARRIVEMV